MRRARGRCLDGAAAGSLLAAALLGAAGCAGVRSQAPATSGGARFDARLHPPLGGLRAEAVDARVEERSVVGGDLLRLRFSFVSYEGYIGEDDAHRSTGTLFLPADETGRALRRPPGPVLLTEFPPGASASGLALQPEYGERPARELGVAAAVVDLRGPIVRSLREYANPSDPAGAPFRGEEQFAYSMLGSYQQTGDLRLLWEYRVARAWLRAMKAVEGIVVRETGRARPRFLLAGERWGALGAAQAAAYEPRVDGLVLCGWPLDWADYHFTRWRRWERAAHYDPLAKVQPIPYDDSRDLLSFLFSSFARPDPACPACRGSGAVWREQFDYLALWRAGRLDGVETLVLVGDSDPDLPLDLEARASTTAEALEAPLRRIPPGGRLPRGAGELGPFSSGRRALPFGDLAYLRGAASTLADRDAVAAVLAWAQHVGGYRDVPAVRIFEVVEGGDIRVEVVVREGNAAVSRVEVWLTEIEDRRDFDFKWPLHLREPEPMRWRRLDATYAGHDARFSGRWRAWFPVDPTRNRAYYVVVRDRVGGLESVHSLPARPLWNLGDPARGPLRF